MKRVLESRGGSSPKLRTYAVSSVLLIGGSRNGVAVVTTEEYQRALEGGGEVEASVCVSFAGRTLPEVADDSPVHVLSLECICSSNRWNMKIDFHA